MTFPENTMGNVHGWCQAKIESGIGLVPEGTKPLPDPMLTKIPVAI